MNSRLNPTPTRQGNSINGRVLLVVLLLPLLATLLYITFLSPQSGGIQTLRAQEANPVAVGVAQGTSFTYQGQLHDGEAAANGAFDFRFRLFNAAEAGSQIGSDVTLNGVTVSDGLFTVALDFGATAFAGEARWLAVEVKPAGATEYTLLTPRQALTATPYALFALNGVPGPQGPIGQTGAQGTQGIQGPPGSADAWSRTGNAGTNPNSNFLGTTDNQPLEIRVNNQRVYQYVPGVGPNIIGGYFENSISPSSVGSIIAGGGGNLGSGFLYTNSISANLATISGGGDNHVSAPGATISGGLFNEAGGEFSVISGGNQNSTSFGFEGSTVGGGELNRAQNEHATISGGRFNLAGGRYSTVGGGNNNQATAFFSTVAGGADNEAEGIGAVVPGGGGNTALGDYSLAAGRLAFANNHGTFVWADNSGTQFTSSNNNQFLIRATGGVGIGMNGPQNQLHVVESIDATGSAANHVVQFQNPNTGTGPDVLALTIGSSGFCNCANFITFFNATSNEIGIGAIQGNGSNGVTYKSVGADYAEWLPKLDPTEIITRGEVVGLFGGYISHQTTGADRVMAISTGAVVAGNDPGDENRDGYALVSFMGQIEVQVRGAVQAGDFIVPSGLEDGTALAIAPEEIASEEFKLVIGQAWESSTDKGVKPILTVVGLAQQDPTLQRLVAQVEAQEDLLASLEARLDLLEAEVHGSR